MRPIPVVIIDSFFGRMVQP